MSDEGASGDRGRSSAGKGNPEPCNINL